MPQEEFSIQALPNELLMRIMMLAAKLSSDKVVAELNKPLSSKVHIKGYLVVAYFLHQYRQVCKCWNLVVGQDLSFLKKELSLTSKTVSCVYGKSMESTVLHLKCLLDRSQRQSYMPFFNTRHHEQAESIFKEVVVLLNRSHLNQFLHDRFLPAGALLTAVMMVINVFREVNPDLNINALTGTERSSIDAVLPIILFFCSVLVGVGVILMKKLDWRRQGQLLLEFDSNAYPDFQSHVAADEMNLLRGLLANCSPRYDGLRQYVRQRLIDSKLSPTPPAGASQ